MDLLKNIGITISKQMVTFGEQKINGMASISKRISILMSISLFCISPTLLSQNSRVDSLSKLLTIEKTDTGKVKLLWQIASASNADNPDTALMMAQEALFKAKSIHYTEGESNALKVLANSFFYIGNYPSALEVNLQRLKLEEKRNNPRNLAGTLMNIGIVYVFQEYYRKALEYYQKSDSVIEKNRLTSLHNQILLAQGDVYDRMNIADSAFYFFNESYKEAVSNNNHYMMGASMTGLGHSYRKMENYQQSQLNYRGAINFLKDGVDNDLYCEATLGYAQLFKMLHKSDSAVYFAKESMNVARKDKRLSRELDATRFITDYYSNIKNYDSAFTYVGFVQHLNDSVNSKSKIREMQIISSTEQFRQRTLDEEKKLAEHKRMQQLQFLLIGIFIPGIFVITFLLNRTKVHLKLIRLLGILSLLFLFEYLTLLLHPAVAEFTHHNPLFEILIFVAIAAILIPLHHKLEHWLIAKLTHHRHINITKVQQAESTEE